MSRLEHENLEQEIVACGRRIERLESRIAEILRELGTLKAAFRELAKSDRAG